MKEVYWVEMMSKLSTGIFRSPVFDNYKAAEDFKKLVTDRSRGSECWLNMEEDGTVSEDDVKVINSKLIDDLKDYGDYFVLLDE
jgi:hypothetical protein